MLAQPTRTPFMLIEQIADAGRAGALLPLARLWASSELTPEATDSVYSAILDEMNRRRRDGDGWPEEERAVVELMRSAADERRWLAELVCRPVEPSGGNRAGWAAILVEGTRPLGTERYGAVWRLRVTATRWAGNEVRKFVRGIASQREDELAELANSVANLAVDNLLLRSLAGASGVITLMRWGRIATIPGVRLPIEGDSLALGIALAVVSAIAEIPLPEGWAFTGRLDADGRVLSVGGIPQKLSGAGDKGLTDVVLPRQGLPLPPTPGLRVHVVDSLEEALSICSPGLVEQAVRVVAGARVPAAIGSLEQVVEGDTARRVLISMVARNDPFGRRSQHPGNAASSEAATTSEEGPLLTIASVVRPTAVWYIYTTGPDRENDLSEAAKGVYAHLHQRYPKADLRALPLAPAEIADPTDLPALMRTVVAAIRSCIADTARDSLGERVRYFMNASSGTPQMQAVMHLLKERGVPASVTLVQVRESKWLKEGESRLRAVELPPLDI